MTEILTKSEFARRLGISPAAVANYISRSKITAPALRPDGRIDVELAVAQLHARLDLVKSAGRRSGRLATTNLVRPKTELRADAADIDIAADLDTATAIEFDALAGNSSAISELAQLKIEQARRGLLRTREDDAARAGMYVLGDAAREEFERQVAALAERIEQRLPELIASLAGEPEQRARLAVARRWWRGLRQAEADGAAGRAAGLPQYVVDAGRTAPG